MLEAEVLRQEGLRLLSSVENRADILPEDVEGFQVECIPHVWTANSYHGRRRHDFFALGANTA